MSQPTATQGKQKWKVLFPQMHQKIEKFMLSQTGRAGPNLLNWTTWSDGVNHGTQNDAVIYKPFYTNIKKAHLPEIRSCDKWVRFYCCCRCVPLRSQSSMTLNSSSIFSRHRRSTCLRSDPSHLCHSMDDGGVWLAITNSKDSIDVVVVVFVLSKKVTHIWNTQKIWCYFCTLLHCWITKS